MLSEPKESSSVLERPISYNKETGELRVKCRIEYGRAIEYVESEDRRFYNLLKGAKTEIREYEEGIRLSEGDGSEEIKEQFKKILERLKRETASKHLSKVIKEREGKEYQTELKGMSYKLYLDSYELRGVKDEIYTVELILKAHEIKGEESTGKKERLKTKIRGLDISITGKIGLNEIYRVLHNEEKKEVEIHELITSLRDTKELLSKEMKQKKQRNKEEVLKIRLTKKYNSRDLSSILRIVESTVYSLPNQKIEVIMPGDFVYKRSNVDNMLIASLSKRTVKFKVDKLKYEYKKEYKDLEEEEVDIKTGWSQTLIEEKRVVFKKERTKERSGELYCKKEYNELSAEFKDTYTTTRVTGAFQIEEE